MDNIKYVFYTHQDPDVSSGISFGIGIRCRFYISKLGKGFYPFWSFDNSKMVVIEDKGGTIRFRDGAELKIIPAHFYTLRVILIYMISI